MLIKRRCTYVTLQCRLGEQKPFLKSETAILTDIRIDTHVTISNSRYCLPMTPLIKSLYFLNNIFSIVYLIEFIKQRLMFHIHTSISYLLNCIVFSFFFNFRSLSQWLHKVLFYMLNLNSLMDMKTTMLHQKNSVYYVLDLPCHIYCRICGCN